MSVEYRYVEYLRTPRSTVELMEHFAATESAVRQMIRTVKLDHGLYNEGGKWVLVGENTPLPTSVTEYNVSCLEILKDGATTRDMMWLLDKKMPAIQQVIRTLVKKGLVEHVSTTGAKGTGGCWFTWQTTKNGNEILGGK